MTILTMSHLRITMSLTFMSIIHIVLMGAETQMKRIDTLGVVTIMKNE